MANNRYINKVLLNDTTLLDLTGDTAVETDVAQGKTFHKANGEQATGTASGGSQNGIIFLTQDEDGYPLTAELNGVTEIFPYMFYNYAGNIGAWYKLTNLSLPPGINKIGTLAFQYCHSLVLNELPDSITSIETYAFNGCSSIELTKLPSGLTQIPAQTFRGCTRLALNSLPRGITSIGVYAFYGCFSLALAEINLPSAILYGYSFYGCESLGSKFKINVQKIGTGSTSGTQRVFQNCTSLQKVWISSNTQDIKASSSTYAPFNGCTALTDIYTDAESQPSGWGAYWNYTASSTQATVHWGVSEAEFDAL